MIDGTMTGNINSNGNMMYGIPTISHVSILGTFQAASWSQVEVRLASKCHKKDEVHCRWIMIGPIAMDSFVITWLPALLSSTDNINASYGKVKNLDILTINLTSAATAMVGVDY
ncbi:hypothetical protein CHS0354_007998 [Potamilus streckersoni]|uniref:Uncharacterized protein n=1 Tax=Potamilus streckersoni TaxID=2493646 RepID=A0AAE0VT04_9BIVA|nr:hypothetical protein CHS0354_007998 [Potamilus streckersoni]